MKLIGEAVKHKSFGTGKIIDFKEQRIMIKFDKCSDIKKFNYPESIGSFLELDNAQLYDKVLENQIIFALKDAEYKRLNVAKV
jgi:hypothetical protein